MCHVSICLIESICTKSEPDISTRLFRNLLQLLCPGCDNSQLWFGGHSNATSNSSITSLLRTKAPRLVSHQLGEKPQVLHFKGNQRQVITDEAMVISHSDTVSSFACSRSCRFVFMSSSSVFRSSRARSQFASRTIYLILKPVNEIVQWGRNLVK